jgi:iron complex transport system substrate-binding protein
MKHTIAMGLFVVACAAAADTPRAQGTYPRSFTDARGHTITLKAKPMRIASVVLGVDENLLDLVDPSRIVTMTEISKEPYISNVADRVPAGKLFIRDQWQQVVDAKPDLVLVATYTKELADPLIARGLPVYQFSEFDSIAALLGNFETLGQLVGEEQKAREITNADRDRLTVARNKKWPSSIKAVYFSEGSLFAAGTVPSQVISFAGLADAAAESGRKGIVKATPALINQLQPDVILVGEDSKEAETKSMAMFRSPEYQAIAAARAGRVYAQHRQGRRGCAGGGEPMSPYWFAPSLRCPDAKVPLWPGPERRSSFASPGRGREPSPEHVK